MTTDIATAYDTVKPRLEAEALELARQQHCHLAVAADIVLQCNPEYWEVYREAIAQGLPSEFQRARRRRTSPTPKDRAWHHIESLARTLVAASSEPLTLRDAVVKVVAANPGLYRQYATARRRRLGNSSTDSQQSAEGTAVTRNAPLKARRVASGPQPDTGPAGAGKPPYTGVKAAKLARSRSARRTRKRVTRAAQR